MAVTKFPIAVLVEESALGTVMKLLHKTPGVIRFDLDLDSLGTKHKNGNGKKRSASMVTPVLLKIGKGATREQLQQYYVEAGGADKSSKSFFLRMRSSKMIAATAGGKYKLGPKGEARLKKAAARHAAELHLAQQQ